MIKLEDLDDNMNALIYAIKKNVSCDIAWTAITGESIGYKPSDIDITNLNALRQEIITLRNKGLTYKQIGQQLNIAGGKAWNIYADYARPNNKPTGRFRKQLSLEERKKIVELRKTMSLRQIAKLYNVSATTIKVIEQNLIKELIGG